MAVGGWKREPVMLAVRGEEMQMRSAIAAAVAAVVVLLGLNPAVADSAATWTVTPGGGFYTATQWTDFSYLTDTTTGAKFQCQYGFWISGKLQSGSGVANPVGKVTTAKGANPGTKDGLVFCSGHGLQIAMAFTHLPWPITAAHYGSAAGVITGTISGIAGTIAPQTSSSVRCTAVFDGSAQGAADGQAGFKYQNSGGEMHIQSTGNLHFYNVSGCRNHINSGDAMIYTPSFVIAAGGSHATNVITSP